MVCRYLLGGSCLLFERIIVVPVLKALQQVQANHFYKAVPLKLKNVRKLMPYPAIICKKR